MFLYGSWLPSPLYSMAFEMLTSPQTCMAFADIFMCLNSADQGGTDWTGNSYLSSTCRFHQIRHKNQVYCTETWVQFFRSSESETSWDLVPHEKDDICTRLLYFDIVCWPETTGNSNCEKQLGMILRSWILSKEKRPSLYNYCLFKRRMTMILALTLWRLMGDSVTKARHRNCPKNLRLSKPTDMTILWKALEEHFLMVPFFVIHYTSSILGELKFLSSQYATRPR
jgi:hypothetical protein